MKLSLGIVQKQSLILSPVLIQQLQIFQSSYEQLLEKIQVEAQENVMMELTQVDELKPQSAQPNDPFYNVTYNQSLTSFLHDQLTHQSLPDQKFQIAVRLISQINEQGFIEGYTQISREMEQEFSVSPRTVLGVLKIIQSLEPSGIAARSLQESLLIQLYDHDFEDQPLNDLLETVIKNHLPDIESGSFDKIAATCGIDEAAVHAVVMFIRDHLNPYPAAAFQRSKSIQTLIPSFKVTFEGEEAMIQNLEAEKGIRFGISKQYLSILKDPKTDAETRAFLSQKLEKLKSLQTMIQERQDRLNELIRVIVSKQRLFFKQGAEYLLPFLQKDLAQELGVANSTISRLLNSKAIETDHGVFLLRTCCPRSYFGNTQTQLKQILSALFDQFPHDSDQNIQKRLHELTIKMARRTVAKYRHDLGKASSYRRAQSQVL